MMPVRGKILGSFLSLRIDYAELTRTLAHLGTTAVRAMGPMAALLIVSGWNFPAGGQEGSVVARGADVMVRETIDVKEILVDAVVTDKTNTPIADLEPDDFTLKVDGKKARITSLLSGRDLRESVSGRVTIVVLFDERHLQAAHRSAVLDDITESLVAEMRTHPTWVAVASLGDQLEPLLPPTPQHRPAEDRPCRCR